MQQDIEELAKRYWEEAGKPSGRDLEFWLKAERSLDLRRIPSTSRVDYDGNHYDSLGRTIFDDGSTY